MHSLAGRLGLVFLAAALALAFSPGAIRAEEVHRDRGGRLVRPVDLTWPTPDLEHYEPLWHPELLAAPSSPWPLRPSALRGRSRRAARRLGG